MKFKVGNQWFEPTIDEPLMVVLTPKEKQDIASMAPDATMYAVFADNCTMSISERSEWMMRHGATDDTQQSKTLKPCPFCGGEAEIAGSTMTQIRCTNDQCISAGAFNDYGHRQAAIESWNRRV